MRTIPTFARAAALAAAVSVAAACGSSTTPAASPSSAASSAASATSSAASSAASTAATSAGDAATAAYCDALKSVKAQGTALGLDEKTMADPGVLAKTKELFGTVRDAAPPEIKKEWENFLTLLDKATTLKTSDAKAMEELSKLAAEAQTGMTKIVEYTKTNCGVDLEK